MPRKKTDEMIKETMIKEKMIIFSNAEVKALKENIKQQFRRTTKNKKYPGLTGEQNEAILDNCAGLLAKAIGQADTRAFNKIMNMAFGKPE